MQRWKHDDYITENFGQHKVNRLTPPPPSRELP